MKIAILVGGLPPKHLGGTEIATYNIAKHLAKSGHQVHVITLLDEGLPKESKEEGFYVHRTKYPRIRFLGIIIFWLKALLLLKKVNPDIVHAQGIGMGMPAFLARKFLRKPYVVWGQGSDVYVAWQFKKQISKLVLKNDIASLSYLGRRQAPTLRDTTVVAGFIPALPAGRFPCHCEGQSPEAISAAKTHTASSILACL